MRFKKLALILSRIKKIVLIRKKIKRITTKKPLTIYEKKNFYFSRKRSRLLVSLSNEKRFRIKKQNVFYKNLNNFELGWLQDKIASMSEEYWVIEYKLNSNNQLDEYLSQDVNYSKSTEEPPAKAY